MEEEECEIPVARFTKWDVLIAFFGMFMGIFHAIEAFWETLLTAAVMASNKQVNDDIFHEEAAREIETLTEGDNG